jgi:hypothetical protein
VGFVVSLGPFIQLRGQYAYGWASGFRLVLPGPWLLVDKVLPQLEFIRAIGRASILVLFGLCCTLAFLPRYLASSKLAQRRKKLLTAGVVLLIIAELLPLHQVMMRPYPYDYNQQVPKVYQYIKAHQEINDIIILRTIYDYKGTPIPVAGPQDVLWAGYTNRNIYNGYSGYKPPGYDAQYFDFVILQPDDVAKMQKLGLRYAIVDKLLSQQKPEVITEAAQLFPNKLYEDSRYVLYKLPTN